MSPEGALVEAVGAEASGASPGSNGFAMTVGVAPEPGGFGFADAAPEPSGPLLADAAAELDPFPEAEVGVEDVAPDFAFEEEQLATANQGSPARRMAEANHRTLDVLIAVFLFIAPIPIRSPASPRARRRLRRHDAASR